MAFVSNPVASDQHPSDGHAHVAASACGSRPTAIRCRAMLQWQHRAPRVPRERRVAHLSCALAQSVAGSDVFAVLPKGARPAHNLYLTVHARNGNTGAVWIQPNGDMSAYNRSLSVRKPAPPSPPSPSPSGPTSAPAHTPVRPRGQVRRSAVVLATAERLACDSGLSVTPVSGGPQRRRGPLGRT
jgi:hypothetical protein